MFNLKFGRTRKIWLALVLLPGLAFASADNGKQELNWVGCGISKKAYVTDLAEAFEKNTGVHINIHGGGATRGIRDVHSGAADLGGSCRYNLPQDPREAGIGLEPVAWDSLVMITHKDNPVEDITLENVVRVYEGKITNWNQLGGDDRPIDVYVRKSKTSGVGRTFRKLVFTDFDKELFHTRSFKSSGPLEKAIMENPNAIAVTGISSARLRDVKILKLDGIEPTTKNVRRGHYKLYRPLYLTYNPKSPRLDTVKEFIRFCHSAEGREVMKKNGVVPYKEALSLIMKQIEQDDSAFKRGLNFSNVGAAKVKE